jgi:hypothetical protein
MYTPPQRRPHGQPCAQRTAAHNAQRSTQNRKHPKHPTTPGRCWLSNPPIASNFDRSRSFLPLAHNLFTIAWAIEASRRRLLMGRAQCDRNRWLLKARRARSEACSHPQRGKTFSSLRGCFTTGGAGPVTSESARAALIFSDVLAGSCVSAGSTIDRAACLRTLVLWTM